MVVPVPVNLSFVGAPAHLGYPGLKSHETVVSCCVLHKDCQSKRLSDNEKLLREAASQLSSVSQLFLLFQYFSISVLPLSYTTN